MCVRACVRLRVCVLIATVREPLSDGQLIGHLTSTEEAARKLAKRATGFNLIPNSFLSRCCPLDNSLSQGNGTKIKKNRIQNRGKIAVIVLWRLVLLRLTHVWRDNGDHARFSVNKNLGGKTLATHWTAVFLCVCVCVFPCCRSLMYFNPCKVPTGFQLGTGFLTPGGETDNYAVDCGCD